MNFPGDSTSGVKSVQKRLENISIAAFSALD
jgi:hypothetical protein